MNRLPRILSLKPHPGFVAVALVSLVVYGWIAIPPATLGLTSDPTHYAILAGYYNESLRGSVDPYTELVYRSSRFPPVWPALLGLLGGGPEAPGALKAITCLCAIGAVLLTWTWVRREFRSAGIAFVGALMLALNPRFFLLNLDPYSESLGMVFMVGALVLTAASHPDRGRAHRAGALLALLALTRAIGLVFAPALALWVLRSRGGIRLAASAALLAGLPLCGWLLFRSTIPGNMAYSTQLSANRDLATFGDWIGFVMSQPPHLAQSFAACLAPVGGPMSRGAAFAIFGLAVAGWIQRFASNRLDACLLGSYLGVLLVWPFPNETDRFLVFVMPILFVCAATAVMSLLAGRAPRFVLLAPWVLLALLVLASGPSILQGLSRVELDLERELSAEKRGEEFFKVGSAEEAVSLAEQNARKRLTAEGLRKVIPKGECVYAVQVTYVFAHSGVPAFEFPPAFLEGKAGAETLRRCRYFYYVGGQFIGDGAPTIDFAKALSGWTRPVLLSTQQVTGGEVIAAALLERIP